MALLPAGSYLISNLGSNPMQNKAQRNRRQFFMSRYKEKDFKKTKTANDKAEVKHELL
jgi:hypothetical protein